jgi:hypothetical protein
VLSKNVKIKIYRTVIFPVVFCGYETWPVTVREEHRLRVFKNGVLRKMFGPEKDEFNGGVQRTIQRAPLWCSLRSVYYSGDQMKNNEMGGM